MTGHRFVLFPSPIYWGGNQKCPVIVWAFLMMDLICAHARAETDGPLTVADLAAYRSALELKTPVGPAPRASFRDLWDRPDDFRGRRVAVSGRVVSVFHQGAFGQFPPLAEVWVFTPASDPFCLVFPESKEKATPKPGAVVGFTGTFLRKVRYHGGDVDRLAPLVVGPEPPGVEQSAPEVFNPPASPFDGIALLVVGGMVMLTLVRVAIRRPRPRPIVEAPTPVFDDGDGAETDQ